MSGKTPGEQLFPGGFSFQALPLPVFGRRIMAMDKKIPNVMIPVRWSLLLAALLFLVLPAQADTPGARAPWASDEEPEAEDREEAEATEEEEGPGRRTIYRVRDARGNVTFTDDPPEDAQEVEEMDVRDPQSMPAPRTPPQRGPEPEEEEDEPFQYERLEISSPEHEENIHNPESVSVSVDVEPSLRPGHRLRLFHNGEPVEGTTLEQPERGKHELQVRVLDAEGNQVQSSDPVTLYIHRASRQIQPGERVRPRPGD